LDLAGVQVDVMAFDRAIAQGDAASLQQAVALYGGPLLEGCGEEWVLLERQQREQAYLSAREQLTEQALQAGEAGKAAGHLRAVIALDPLRESAQRGLLQALAASGDYAAAVQVYRELRLLLRRDLNTEPAPETRALFEQVRQHAREQALAHPPSLRAPMLAVTVVTEAAPSEQEALAVPAEEILLSGAVTLLFSDIVDSTGLWERQPQAMRQALSRHDALLRQAIEAHGGQVFKTIGVPSAPSLPMLPRRSLLLWRLSGRCRRRHGHLRQRCRSRV
jgi:hypothetical protein